VLVIGVHRGSILIEKTSKEFGGLEGAIAATSSANIRAMESQPRSPFFAGSVLGNRLEIQLFHPAAVQAAHGHGEPVVEYLLHG